MRVRPPSATRDRLVRCCHLRGRTANATDRFFHRVPPASFAPRFDISLPLPECRHVALFFFLFFFLWWFDDRRIRRSRCHLWIGGVGSAGGHVGLDEVTLLRVSRFSRREYISSISVFNKVVRFRSVSLWIREFFYIIEDFSSSFLRTRSIVRIFISLDLV